jgi:hypothetical protein
MSFQLAKFTSFRIEKKNDCFPKPQRIQLREQTNLDWLGRLKISALQNTQATGTQG